MSLLLKLLKTVLFPLTWLANRVRAIRSSRDPPARAKLGGKSGTSRMLDMLDLRQKALTESEERYKTLVENIDLGVALIDTNHHIVMMNTGLARFFHKQPADMIGRHCFREFEKRDEICKYCPGVRATAEDCKAEVETKGVRDDGTSFHIRIQAFPLFGGRRELIGFIEVVEDISEQKELKCRVSNYQERLKTLAFELSLMEDRTRKQFAAELHDLIGQTLCMAKFRMQWTLKTVVNAADAAGIAEATALIDEAITKSRKLVFDLYPPVLSDFGLSAALEWLVEEFDKSNALRVRFREDSEIPSFSIDLSSILLKAARELMLNVVKHARATEATVSVWKSDDYVHVSVEDNGIGCSGVIERDDEDGVKSAHGFGLFGIRERVELIGGYLKLDSSPGAGTRVEVAVPLHMAFV